MSEDRVEELMQEEIANLSDKVDDLGIKLGSLQGTCELQAKQLQASEVALSAANTQNGILKDEIADLLEEIVKVKKQAKPIVEFASGNYNRWRHHSGGRPTLLDAYDFFKNYIKD